jgi:TetR/AcrR family transcriptional repressor of nem operon
MPRQREFDPDQALQTAISLFWEKGFYDTSVDEVVKRSGVAKYGIYGTFGTKRELFKKVLTRYADDRRKDIQAPIRKAEASLPEILKFFNALPTRLTRKDFQHGCLIANTGVELGARDAEFSNFVKAFFTETTEVMQRCLQRAVEDGQLKDPGVDIGLLAVYLVTEFRSALMLSASGCTSGDIRRHLEVALRVLH